MAEPQPLTHHFPADSPQTLLLAVRSLLSGEAPIRKMGRGVRVQLACSFIRSGVLPGVLRFFWGLEIPKLSLWGF